MRFHTSSETVTCEKHPLYAEDACKECEKEKEEESEWLEQSLKDSKAGVYRTLTSQEIVFADALRAFQVAKCKGLGDFISQAIGWAWSEVSDMRILQSYEEAGHKIEMMVL
jgi:hypothetical protein